MISIRCNSRIKFGTVPENLKYIQKEFRELNLYSWKGINYPSGKDDQKNSEKNNPIIALNVFYIKKMNMYPTYISKHNLNHENQIILLLITNVERWHYFAVKYHHYLEK